MFETLMIIGVGAILLFLAGHYIFKISKVKFWASLEAWKLEALAWIQAELAKKPPAQLPNGNVLAKGTQVQRAGSAAKTTRSKGRAKH